MYGELIGRAALFVCLVRGSVQDCRRREIAIRLPCVMAIAGAVWVAAGACAEETSPGKVALELLMALLPGVFFGLVAMVTGQMGYGDGLVIGMVGLWCGMWQCLFTVGISFFLMAMFSAGILILHRANRRTRIPYLPFLTIAYLVQTVLWLNAEMG